MYFLFFKLHQRSKRFAIHPQTIYSELPQEKPLHFRQVYRRERAGVMRQPPGGGEPWYHGSGRGPLRSAAGPAVCQKTAIFL